MQVVFLHGLETGPYGTKYHALRGVVPDLLAPDCEGIFDIDERLAVIERELAGKNELLLVGSSFGGLAAVLFASRHPERVIGCVLCAPAVEHLDIGTLRHLPVETVILHGRQDDVVPLAASEALAARFATARLLVVEDGHRLASSLDVLVDEVRAMMQRLAGPAGR